MEVAQISESPHGRQIVNILGFAGCVPFVTYSFFVVLCCFHKSLKMKKPLKSPRFLIY